MDLIFIPTSSISRALSVKMKAPRVKAKLGIKQERLSEIFYTP
jgi:hypothetical protein